MDGLLLDTEPLYRAAWQKACAHFGYELTFDLYKRLAGRNRSDAVRMLVDRFGEKFPIEPFRVLVHEYEEVEFSKGPIPKRPGVDVLLSLLEAQNIPRAVATSSEMARAKEWLAGAGVLDMFAVLATGDQVPRGKPAPDIFLLAASRLGAASGDCLVLEDAEPGVRAARAAGMRVYLVPDLIPPTPEGVKLAEKLFDSLSDVARDLEYEFASTDSAT